LSAVDAQAVESGRETRPAQRERLGRLLGDPRLRTLCWTFLDQGVVSIGMFATQLALARGLPPAEYGVFVLVLGGMMTLQLCNATLIFHPMSVRVPTANADRASLLGASLLLLLALSALLGAGLGLAVAALGRPDLAAPAVTAFLAWQLQEGLRRGLLSGMRHAAAVTGDTVTYVGQALAVLGLTLAGAASAATALHALAACSLLGAAAHAARLAPARPARHMLRATRRDYWSIGGMPALGGGLLGLLRIMIVPWTLGVLAGAGQVAALQAASNVVNLVNPLILGLGNIIPQVASAAWQRNPASAWPAARLYGLAAAPPLVLFSAAVLAKPDLVLRTFYGEASEYLTLGLALRLMVLVALSSYVVEVVISFLHGIARVRQALAVNAAGISAALVLTPLLIPSHGIEGGCAALLLSNLVRLAAAGRALARMTAPTAAGPAATPFPQPLEPERTR